MIDEKDIQDRVNRRLSGLAASEQRRMRIRTAINAEREEAQPMKRTISKTLVFAIVAVMLMATVAIAEHFNLFNDNGLDPVKPRHQIKPDRPGKLRVFAIFPNRKDFISGEKPEIKFPVLVVIRIKPSYTVIQCCLARILQGFHKLLVENLLQKFNILFIVTFNSKGLP